MPRFLNLFLPFLLLLALGLPADAATRKSRKKHLDRPDLSAQLTDANGVPVVRAASVCVVDAKSGQVLYQKNAFETRPPASTQKLLTALLVAEAGNLDAPVRVEPIDTEAEPVKLGFKPGDVYTRRELLQVLLVHSMNDVARCLARDNAGSVEAFAARMNRKAAELGMNDSHFENPNGLPAPGQHSTAHDMAKVARAAYANRTIRSIVAMKSLAFRYADGHVRVFENTNRVLKAYPLCNGMKTGYTESAGKCLIASGANAGHDVIAVVLGDSPRLIWQDSYRLLAWGLSL
jgi:D-alanyl-D-alanine carboxypeptidase (penicillin-binding protein 5/6)